MSTRLPHLAAAGAILLLSLTASAAMPRHGGQYQGYSDDMQAPPSPYAEPGGSNCVPQCSADTSPCDPYIFKRMDGRCMSVR